ncbi:MAG: hypothetical protein U0531_09175 [Dehalococcoidia bacterium]
MNAAVARPLDAFLTCTPLSSARRCSTGSRVAPPASAARRRSRIALPCPAAPTRSGGAANTAANVAALERVRPSSRLSAPTPRSRCASRLRQHRVGVDDLLVGRARRTLAKQRVVADGHLLLRLDQGTTELLGSGR